MQSLFSVELHALIEIETAFLSPFWRSSVSSLNYEHFYFFSVSNSHFDPIEIKFTCNLFSFVYWPYLLKNSNFSSYNSIPHYFCTHNFCLYWIALCSWQTKIAHHFFFILWRFDGLIRFDFTEWRITVAVKLPFCIIIMSLLTYIVTKNIVRSEIIGCVCACVFLSLSKNIKTANHDDHCVGGGDFFSVENPE